MPLDSQFSLLGLDFQELTALFHQHGEPPFRARQLLHALYRERRQSLAGITTLSSALRMKLADAGYSVGLPEIEQKFCSADGTIRYLVRLGDGETVETVWMPEGDGGERGDSEELDKNATRDFDRATICVSSQAGCAVNCRFCLTALLGVQRNLTAGEIVGQVLGVLNERAVPAASRINLVFMGQGEPFLNYENFMKAVRLLVEEAGIPEARMTVSTAGIVPRIYDFGKEPVRPKLAISLNGSNDEQRGDVMPINRKWPIAEILEAARAFPLRKRERLTFEYVLLGEVNDSVANARELVLLLEGLRAKVNLIALNPGPEIPFHTPAEDRVLRFQEELVRAGIPAFIRRPRGRDIYAACGQLKRATDALVSLA